MFKPLIRIRMAVAMSALAWASAASSAQTGPASARPVNEHYTISASAFQPAE